MHLVEQCDARIDDALLENPARQVFRFRQALFEAIQLVSLSVDPRDRRIERLALLLRQLARTLLGKTDRSDRQQEGADECAKGCRPTGEHGESH